MRSPALLTPAIVHNIRQRISYDPYSGAFEWVAPSKWRNDVKGRGVGSRGLIQIDGVKYNARRLAWAMHHGELSMRQRIRCIQNKNDYRISNLERY